MWRSWYELLEGFTNQFELRESSLTDATLTFLELLTPTDANLGRQILQQPFDRLLLRHVSPHYPPHENRVGGCQQFKEGKCRICKTRLAQFKLVRKTLKELIP